MKIWKLVLLWFQAVLVYLWNDLRDIDDFVKQVTALSYCMSKHNNLICMHFVHACVYLPIGSYHHIARPQL